MGLVIQFQRRAIEALLPHVIEKPIPSNLALGAVNFSIKGGSRLFALGVSPGYGTCASIHDMNVLVLGEQRPKSTPWLPAQQPICHCAYAVLLRDLTKGEYVEWCRSNLYHVPNLSQRVIEGLPTSQAIEKYISRTVCCVELLQVAQVAQAAITWTIIGHKAFYVVLC
ncbi:MAG: hypothetical protein WC508_01580 [Patescibacteria group bacterium]